MERADDYLPTASVEMLRLRAQMLSRVRRFFDQRGFLEVETPLLSADVVVDRHLDPLGVILPSDPRRPDVGRKLWLQTSPEFAMKRLLAAGYNAIYQVCKAFRGAERGPLHNPEFTMLEWYRAGDDYGRGMQLLAEFAEALLPFGPPEQMSFAEAFQRHAGIQPHVASAAELRAAAERLGIAIPPGFAARDGESSAPWRPFAHSGAPGEIPADPCPPDRDAWLDLILVERVQPRLGVERPLILYDFPASQAALARVRTGSEGVQVAERFELYVHGMELANGYHELLDPAVLRARARAANFQRRQEGKPALPEESRLLAAMEQGLPACSGAALGFDRLVLCAAGASTIDEVIAFPIERA